MNNRVAHQLVSVLDKENAALIAGDFDTLFAMTDEKVAALEGLEKHQLTHDVGLAIAAQIMRNQSLLEASANGVRSAGKMLAKLRSATTGSTVYGPNGEVSRMEKNSDGLSQKL